MRCSIVSCARASGLQPSEPTGSAALFLGNETALCHARGNDSLRMAAARASSSFQTSRQQLSWLNSLFAMTG